MPLQGDPVLKNADFGRAINSVNQDDVQHKSTKKKKKKCKHIDVSIAFNLILF